MLADPTVLPSGWPIPSGRAGPREVVVGCCRGRGAIKLISWGECTVDDTGLETLGITID